MLLLCLMRQEEHEQIRAKKGEGEALEWSDYKSMAFTQCVRYIYMTN